MGPIEFALALFQHEGDRDYSEGVMLDALEFLTKCNERWLAHNPGWPGVYESGVVYQREKRRRENWQSIPAMDKTKKADCEDLACRLAAELRRRPAELAKRGDIVRVSASMHKKTQGTFTLYHIRVRLEHRSGAVTYEDPSEKLGMRVNRERA